MAVLLRLRRMCFAWSCLVLLIASGCGDGDETSAGTDAGSASDGSNASTENDGSAGAEATNSNDSQTATAEIADPEELGRKSFDAFCSNDREAAKRLTMAGLTVEQTTDLIRTFRESGLKGPERDRDKSDAEIAAQEHARAQKEFDEAYTRFQANLKAKGIDPSQAKFIRFDIRMPNAEEAAKMKERIPFDFADVSVIFESGGDKYRFHVDDCFKIPGVGWRSGHIPSVRTFSPEGAHSHGATSAAAGVTAEELANSREIDNTTEPDTDHGEETRDDVGATNATIGFEVGNMAPEIRGQDVDGVAFKLSDYRGKVVLLDFWGDW